MPRSNRPVKRLSRTRPLEAESPGLVDLHFHGALGVDLALPHQVARLSRTHEWQEELATRGLAGFCPTLLSLEPGDLNEAVRALGAWIHAAPPPNSPPLARPLGIHLEGPFLSNEARGAHPRSAVRSFQPSELESLWEQSRGTLRILTLAPETLSSAHLRWLSGFATRTGIRLNLGHSRATEIQARRALQSGFSGVTHAWNAMAFHHREPGILGAALGHPGVTVELIPDHLHVHPTVLRWTRLLHPNSAWVSDCTPASAFKKITSFGPSLKVQQSAGASRLGKGPQAPLAGGGPLLPEQLRAHLSMETKDRGVADARTFSRLIRREITEAAHRQPLRFLGFSARRVAPLKLLWALEQRASPPHGPSQIVLTVG